MRICLAGLGLIMAMGCSNEKSFRSQPATGSASADAKPVVEEAEVPLPTPSPEPVPMVVPEAKPIPEPVPDVIPEAEEPGEPVEQFGVNFEDIANSDADYNDAVLCFKGSFGKFDKLLTSKADQQVEFTTSSDAGCSLNIEVTIIRKDGSQDPAKVYNAKAKETFLLDFKKGDSINVVMIPVSAECGGPNARREMTDDNYGKIEASCR